jgi:hypothetical protein
VSTKFVQIKALGFKLAPFRGPIYRWATSGPSWPSCVCLSVFVFSAFLSVYFSFVCLSVSALTFKLIEWNLFGRHIYWDNAQSAVLDYTRSRSRLHWVIQNMFPLNIHVNVFTSIYFPKYYFLFLFFLSNFIFFPVKIIIIEEL